MSDIGRKDDYEKLPMELISPWAEEKLAKILQIGAKTYGRRNWELGINFSRIIGALKRHLTEFQKEIGLNNPDPKSLENHAFHMHCNTMFLAHYMALYEMYKEFDDRQK